MMNGTAVLPAVVTTFSGNAATISAGSVQNGSASGTAGGFSDTLGAMVTSGQQSNMNSAVRMNADNKAVMNGEEIPADWTGTLQTGSVVLTELNDAVAASGTAEKLEEVKAALKDGSLQVFDASTFTVSGSNLNDNIKVDAEGHVTSYMADVDTDAAYTGDTEVVENGAFQESVKRSAPYFDLKIDGILCWIPHSKIKNQGPLSGAPGNAAKGSAVTIRRVAL